MSLRSHLAPLLTGLLALGATLDAQATVSLGAVRDNTIWEDPAGGLSNGAGFHLFAGRSGGIGPDQIRRALIDFDVAASIPAGSTILSADLEVFCTRSAGGSQTMTLHRVTADWGAGTSNSGTPGGAGAPSAPGDATWLHRFYPSTNWTTVGGDFNAAVLDSTSVSVPNAYSFTSAQLTAAVQDMLDNPGSDHGFMLRGNEASAGTARRFDSSDNLGGPPMLHVTYAAPVPALPAGALLVLTVALVGAGALLLHRRPVHA